MNRKTLILMLLSLALGIGLFFIVLGRSGFNDILIPFKSFSPLYLSLFMFTSLLIWFFSVLRWRMILYHMGHKVPIKKLFAYKAAGFAISYVTPSARVGGEPVRAMMLSRNNIPIDRSYASIALDKIIDFSTGAVIMSIALFISLITYPFPLGVTLFLGGTIVAALVLFYVVYSRLLKRRGLVSKILEITRFSKIKFVEGLNEHVKNVERYSGDFLRSKKYVSELLILSGAMWILFLLEFKFALLSIGFDASILQIFLVMLFFGAMIILPVPAAIGVLEAGQAFAFSLLQANPSLGIAVALVLRFKDLIWSLLGFTVISRRGLKSMSVFKK